MSSCKTLLRKRLLAAEHIETVQGNGTMLDQTQAKGMPVRGRNGSLCMYTGAPHDCFDRCQMADRQVKHKREKTNKQHDLLDITFCKIAASRQ